MGKRKDQSERRQHRIGTRLTDAEVELVDARRGSVSRGEWLRRAALGRPPRVIPEINREVWSELARIGGNLNQIARKLNQAGYATEADARAARAEIDRLRAALIGALDRDGYEEDADEGES